MCTKKLFVEQAETTLGRARLEEQRTESNSHHHSMLHAYDKMKLATYYLFSIFNYNLVDT
jgi:hypothetical protein